MRCYIFLILFFIFPKLFYAQNTIKTTSVNLNLRKDPRIENNIICIIPEGSSFPADYSNQLDSNWVKINFNGNIGYVYAKYISNPTVNDNYSNTTGSVKYYRNSNGAKIQLPTYYTSPPAGATAECRDGTYSFSRNRRGTCSSHGGVKRWL